MKNQNEAKIMNILIFINSSWGEIEWILPVCRYIKSNYTKKKVIILFNSLDYNDIIKDNHLIYKLLLENVDSCYDFKDFLPSFLRTIYKIVNENIYKKSVFRKLNPVIKKYFFGALKKLVSNLIIEKIQPDVFLKDTSRDILIRKHLLDLARSKGCREIMYPHSSLIYKDTPVTRVRTEYNADDILCNTEYMTKLFPDSNSIYKNKKHVVGIPKYDRWWIEYQQDFYIKNNPIKFNKDSNKNLILFLTRNPHPKFLFDKKTADEIIREVMDVVTSIENSYVIIKPHPRQDLENLKNLLKKYDKDMWIIDQSQAMYLSIFSDIIICMGGSSVVVDILAIDKFSIEYYKYSDIDYLNEYDKLGFIAFTTNKKELKEIIAKTIDDPSKVKKKYVDNFRKIFPETHDEFSKKAAEVILNVHKN
jgi:hypothetical protein